MKLFKSLILGAACVASLTSCNDWLDINDNPNSPTDDNVAYYQRLPHMQFYTNSAYQFSAMRTNMGCGDWTMNSRTSTYGAYSQWQMGTGPITTAYQWFFVGAASNFNKMFEKAEAAGAWHYMGATHVLRAYGFMLMTDLYGEMPYTEAHQNTNTPAYDTGKTIYLGCLNEIEEAIKCFEKEQAPLCEPLSTGDWWNNGDVEKWKKLCYLLKARWINKLIKKGEGKITRDESGKIIDAKWDAEEILNCLAKAQQSNADNTVLNHTDDNGLTTDVLGWSEPVDYSPLYSVLGMNSNYYVTKQLVDNFTNFAGLGVEDPRADKIIPWARSQKGATTPAEIKWSEDGKWRRSVGVDMHTTIRTTGTPYTTSWSTENGGHFYCNSSENTGDTIYIHQTSSSKGYAANRNLFYYRNANYEHSAMSGTFHSRVSAPTWVGAYHEACFIKAEVLFRQGKTGDAFNAYKEGVKANIELMNAKLNVWVGEDKDLAECPSFAPMVQEDIDNYLTNGIGTAGDLTLAKIMTQKHMAMMFSVEQYNDMRRYDYDSNVFLNWEIPAEYYINSTAQKYIPLGKQLRRWRQCSHEYNYNSAQLIAIGAKVPGAKTDSDNWNMEDDAWTINVWWDSDQE